MDVILDRVCGMDVHRDTVKACVRVPGTKQKRESHIATFGTMTEDLLALRDWLQGWGVKDVAMESTGEYWKPVYYVLEGAFSVRVVNAQHIKNVPGRKTDTQDSIWIAELLECGLLRGSFVPPPEIRDLRDLTRYRKVLTQQRTEEVQRLHGVLQKAGIKLSSVASSIMGVSGRAMMDMLVNGKTDVEALANLARGKLRSKLPQLRKALEGHFSDHHRFLVAQMLAHIDYLEESLGEVSRQIEEQIRPFAEQKQLLMSIPGVQDKVAEAIMAEIGLDMEQFPTDRNLISWAGLCPGNNQSAGKRKSGKTRKGDRWLRAFLTEAAWAAVREDDSYLAAQFHRLAPRKGKKKAIVAVASSLLQAAYFILRERVSYRDLGRDFYVKRNQDAIRRRCIRQLQQLGYQVQLTEYAA